MDKIVFQGILYNKNFSPKWNILVKENSEGIFEVEENTDYSLFSNPLATGKTIPEALDNFFKVEQTLINNL